MTKKAWVDIETTDIDENEGVLLEIYCRIEEDGETIAEFESLVLDGAACDPSLPFRTWIDSWPSFTRDMHGKNGLIDDLRKVFDDASCDVAVVGARFEEFLKKYNGGDPKSLYIAGSSVKFDWAWLKAKMPRVLDQVHYRVIDVSSTRIQMMDITGEDWVYPKEKGHRAKKDIDEAIAEYKFLWNKFKDWVAERSSPGETVKQVDLWENPKDEG